MKLEYCKEMDYISDVQERCNENNPDVCKHCDHKRTCKLLSNSFSEELKNEQISAKRRKSIYEKICEGRKPKDTKELQESLWNKLSEQWDDDFDVDGDSTIFTKSEECDGLMERYEEDLIKVLSGLEDTLPDWYGIETEEEE